MADKTLIQRAKKIKLLLTDVDGVLTDGSMNFTTTPEGKFMELKRFNAYDGVAFHILRDCGLQCGIITGGNAPATEYRANALGMNYLYYNFLSKLDPLEDLVKRTGITFEQIAYIGDDLIDYPVLQRVGLACAVKSGCEDCKKIAHYITKKEGGQGVFREVAELLLKAQGFWPAVIKSAEMGTIGTSPKPSLLVVNRKKAQKECQV